jgi:hypothetical protein
VVGELESRLGIGAVSVEVIDAVIDYANRERVELMLLVSRNQIDYADLGGGYVPDLTPERLVEHVRERSNGFVRVCRDHGGPYLRDDDEACAPEEAFERAAYCIECDIAAGFELLHLDPSGDSSDPYDTLERLVAHATSCAASAGRPVLFEISTEPNDGSPTDDVKVAHDLEFVTSLVEPYFYVVQTGSLVQGTFQAGTFDEESVRRAAAVAEQYGVRLKEHNVDYAEEWEMVKRRRSRIHAFNVAPEFGVLQTRTILQLAHEHSLDAAARRFVRVSYESGKWQKWLWPGGESAPDEDKAVIAGHYNYGTDAYRELVEALEEYVDVECAVRSELQRLLDGYVQALVRPDPVGVADERGAG